MKFAYPEINEVFDTENRMYNSVVIENKRLLADIITDLYNQKEGFEGKTIISENHAPIQISKRVDIIDKFIPFQLNTKSIINGIASALEKCAVNEENITKSLSLVSETERFLAGLAFQFPCSISTVNMRSFVEDDEMEKFAETAIMHGYDIIAIENCAYKS